MLLIKSYINSLIKEYYDDGGDYGGSYGHGSGGELFFKDIYNAFKDPISHSLAAVEGFSSKLQYVAGKLAHAIDAAIIPGYIANFDKYDKEYQERMNRISEKYKDVFARTESHLFTGDAALIGFLHDPFSYITGRVAKSSPEVALDIVDALAGGNENVHQATGRLRKSAKRMRHWLRMSHGPTSPNPQPIPIEEGVVGDALEALSSFFKNKELKNIINSSSVVRQMHKDAEIIAKDYIKGVIELTKKELLSLQNSEKLNNATNGELKKLADKEDKQDVKKVARMAAEKASKSIKKVANGKLAKKIKELPRGEKSEIAKIYVKAMEIISKL